MASVTNAENWRILSIMHCSLGAEALGVKPGMRISEAIGLCQRLRLIHPDMPFYQRRFDSVLNFLEDFSPIVEGSDLGSAYLLLDGLSNDPEAYVRNVVSRLHKTFGLMASIGIAASKFVSRVAAEITPAGHMKSVPERSEKDLLAPLPVEYLPLQPQDAEWMRRLGLLTIGSLASLPLSSVQAQFGWAGKRYWELANGIDRECLVPRVRQEIISRTAEMPVPAMNIQMILTAGEHLLRAAYNDSAINGRPVRKIVVQAKLDRGGAWELGIPFREAVADADHAWFVVENALLHHPPEAPVEELKVELMGIGTDSGKQLSMLDGGEKRWRQIEETARQLKVVQGGALLGRIAAIKRAALLPEERTALFPIDP
jgi:hypothetical protein